VGPLKNRCGGQAAPEGRPRGRRRRPGAPAARPDRDRLRRWRCLGGAAPGAFRL